MPTQNIHVVTEVGTLADAYEALAKLQKTLNYLINGNLDFENIRARSIKTENIEAGAITANEITVDELSAITANLGHITAGLMEAVQIFGSYIATSTGYPRCEMSDTTNLFGAYTSATKSAVLEPASPQSVTGSPILKMTEDAKVAGLGHGVGTLGYTGFQSNIAVEIHSPDGVYLGGTVFILDWNSLRGYGIGNQTLQQALNGKATVGSSTGSGGGANGGIAPGTRLATSSDGVNVDGYVTWNGIPSHSHTQF
jgi:hypothetical protein